MDWTWEYAVSVAQKEEAFRNKDGGIRINGFKQE